MMCDNCGRATRKRASKTIGDKRYCGRESCRQAFNDHLARSDDTKYVHWRKS